MAEKHVLSALKRQYALTLGAIVAGEDRAEDLRALAHVIVLFQPGARLSAIHPIRPYKPHRGRWARTAMRVLREANAPMRGRDLTRRVMALHGLDLADFRTLDSIETSLLAVLIRLQTRGLVVASGKPRRWAIKR